MKTSHPHKGVVLVQKTSRRRLKLFLHFYRDSKKHLIVSLPQLFSKWLRELPACHYGEVDQSAPVNITFHETWCWLRQAPTLHFFFFKLYSTIYANYCRVQCHSRKESGLTWNQLQPHYDHFVVFCDSIEQATMTEQYEYEASLTASKKCDVLDTE